MAMKPNYRQEKLTRERSRNAKQQEKLNRREADAAKRKARREAETQGSEPEKS
jgi:hypothetical protein